VPGAGTSGARRDPVSVHAERTLAALRVRNYRLYFARQAVSLIGTWMQSVALAWLVLELTHSGTAIGLVIGVQFLPVLVHGAWIVGERVPPIRSAQPGSCELSRL
jgi:hypothetical protein